MATYRRSRPGGESTHEWRSEKQKQMVLARLKAGGVELAPETPPQVCWEALTDLMLKELRGH